MSDLHSHDMIGRAAARAAERPFYLARAIAAFMELRHMDERHLAEFLRCSPDMLPLLGLCRRPDADSPQFQTDVRRIVKRFDVDARSLLQLLREVSSIEAMRRSQPETSTGFLMAARDKSPRQRADNKKEDG